MVLFGLADYEDYFLSLFLKSSYAKRLISGTLMCLVTWGIRFHIGILICWLFGGTWTGNIILPVVFNTLLYLSSSTIYRYVEQQRIYFDDLSYYLIREYSLTNFLKWKRIVLLCLFTYILSVLSIATFNNEILIISTLQTLIVYIICDIIDNNALIINFFRRLYNKRLDQEQYTLIDIKEIRENLVVLKPISPIKVKPLTPPPINKNIYYNNEFEFDECDSD